MAKYRPTDYERFTSLLAPTPDEVAQMVSDLQLKLGGLRQVAQVTGASLRSIYAWQKGNRKAEQPAVRALWLVWSLICRPGSVSTVFDLSTCGRFSARADPATAGDRLGRNFSKLTAPTPGPEVCPECGQELPPG